MSSLVKSYVEGADVICNTRPSAKIVANPGMRSSKSFTPPGRVFQGVVAAEAWAFELPFILAPPLGPTFRAPLAPRRTREMS